MHSINFGKVNLQSLDCLHNQNLKKWLTQPSSVGLEFKYKSQEVFSYLALVFEDSFQTTLLMSLSQSYSNTYVNLLVNGLILFQNFCCNKIATKEVHVEPNNRIKWRKRQITRENATRHLLLSLLVVLDDSASRACHVSEKYTIPLDGAFGY